MIQIEPVLSRENVPVTGESVADYMLAKLYPQVSAETQSLPLNISLVIDNSGSMYGSDQRIVHAIEAACHVTDMLAPRDIVSVVAFQTRPKTFQDSISAENKDEIKRVIRSITSWESGRTRMAAGMEMAIQEVTRNLSSNHVNQILLLTDGKTEAPQECKRMAEQASGNSISFSTFGVGEQWNKPLLEQISNLSGGDWYYIDDPQKTIAKFEEEIGGLQQTVLNTVALQAVLKQGVAVKKVRKVVPEIADVVAEKSKEREVVVKVGSMQRGTPVFLLFKLSLANRQPGKYQIIDLSAMYDVPGESSQRAKTDSVPVTVSYTTDTSQLWQNGEVLRYVDEEHVDAMVKKGTKLAEQGEKDKATKLLSAARQVSDRTGDEKKTQLIQEALEDLGADGQIDRKTQLAMADRARKTQLMPDDEVEELKG
jgi:Ca-activated chloride channel family protein